MQARRINLAALAALLFTFGCAPRWATATVHHAPLGWVRVMPPGAGIAAEMPGHPRIERARGVEDDGTPVITTSVRSDVGSGTFGILVADFEGGTVGDPSAQAQHFAEGMLGELDLEHTRAERLDVPGFYARQDVAVHRAGLVVAIRQYVGARRIYVAVAAVPARPELAGMADRFLDSIRIDPADRLYRSAAGAEGWTPVYSPGDEFAVDMPAVSYVRASALALPRGEVDQRVFEGAQSGAVYRVRVIADRGAASLDDVAAALSLGAADGPTHASGFPGRRYRSADERVVSRLYRTAGRIYVLEAAAATDAARFFESFRIL